MWEAVRWLHLLAMAFFVGGQLVLAAAVVPAFRGAEGRDREPLRAIARRFGQGTILVGAHLRRPTNHALDGAIFLVSLAIVWLGIAIAH